MPPKIADEFQPKKVGRPRAAQGGQQESTRHEILVAAARLFSRQGYGGTQLNHIAAEAKLRTPSLYYYFTGKEEIRLALSAYAVDESAAFATDMVNRGGRASVNLYKMLKTHIARLTSGPFDLWFLMHTSRNTQPNLDSETDLYTQWKNSVMALIERAVVQNDLRTVDSYFALHMIIGCVQGALELRHQDEPTQADEIVDFILFALATDSAHAEEIRAASLAT